MKSSHTACDHSVQISLGSVEWLDCQNKVEGVYPYIISGKGDGSGMFDRIEERCFNLQQSSSFLSL
jgi:hypothetical protein